MDEIEDLRRKMANEIKGAFDKFKLLKSVAEAHDLEVDIHTNSTTNTKKGWEVEIKRVVRY